MKKATLTFFLIVISLSSKAYYNKVVINDPDALCLDGSPGAYYISIGKYRNKFIVYFEGGGWCGEQD